MSDAKEFLESTLRPTLMDMDMLSRSAEKLLLMTAAHESGGFRHARQIGGGPALSYYQIEPDTLVDLYRNYLGYRPERKGLLDQFLPADSTGPETALMDPVYATAAARMIYYRVPEPLPDMEDDTEMARYWKTYWNTHLGKGTGEKFLDDWNRYKPEGY